MALPPGWDLSQYTWPGEPSWEQQVAQQAAQPPALAAPSGPPPLEQDPTYLAFVRALGAQRDQLTNQAQTQREQAQTGLESQLPGIARSGEYGREQISGGYETRGLLHSGTHEQALARQRQSEGDRVSALRQQTANQIGGIDANLSQGLTGLDEKLAEQRLNSAQGQQTHADDLTLQQQLSNLQMPAITGGIDAGTAQTAGGLYGLNSLQSRLAQQLKGLGLGSGG